MIETLPDKTGSFGQKAPMPSEWAGLKDMEFAVVSDIPDAVFMHSGRFIVVIFSCIHVTYEYILVIRLSICINNHDMPPR